MGDAVTCAGECSVSPHPPAAVIDWACSLWSGPWLATVAGEREGWGRSVGVARGSDTRTALSKPEPHLSPLCQAQALGTHLTGAGGGLPGKMAGFLRERGAPHAWQTVLRRAP